MRINKCIRKLLTKIGWQDCQNCNEFIKPKYIQDWIIHPEEPPLFYHYECPKCKAITNIEATRITKKAVKKLGYKDFMDYYNKVILKGGKDEL